MPPILENDNTIFFDGGIFNMQTIKSALENYSLKDTSIKDTSLIIRSDSKMELESFLKLCSMIEDAGYGNIQILAQPEKLNELF